MAVQKNCQLDEGTQQKTQCPSSPIWIQGPPHDQDLETRNGAYRRQEAFSPVERTSNVEARNALHRRVLSALTFTPLLRGERPRSGHRPRTRARDGRTMDAKLMRWQQIIMTFGARVQIMSTSGSACEMDQESRKYRGACPRRCPPRHATHIVDSHARFRRTQFEKSSR